MIALEMVEEIRRLLEADQLSQRQIADRVGVSRGTVNAIAAGRGSHGDRVPRPSGPPRRCPGCGGLVQMPCVACGVRAILRRQRERQRRRPAPPRPARDPSPLISPRW